jgi:transcriptional regulator NrdR family protein
MTCPACGSAADEVIKSRDYGHQVYRRRQCKACGWKHSTIERRARLIDHELASIDKTLRPYVALRIAKPARTR